MRKLLETSSVAQCLDGVPSGGEPAFPRTVNLAMPEGSGKLFDHLSSVFRAVRIRPCARAVSDRVRALGLHSRISSSPERLICLMHRLLPRQSDVVEEMRIIGKIAKGGAPLTSFGPAQPFVQQRGSSEP
jgi:hypothetical protein